MPTIILTGANGNLGLSVTERLLNDGHRVIATVGPSGAGELPVNPKLETASLDLLDDRATGAFVQSAASKYPDLQAAVLLVGGFAMGKLADTTPELLDRMIRLNFHTAFHVVRHLLPHFLSRPEGGQFILVGSRPGLDAAAGKDFFAYSLSKAMVFKLAEFINAEGKSRNITATVIVPSTIDTPANRQAMPGADFSSWTPPQNIADAISFVLSETGRMMRETVIKIYNRA
jgi:NAD(P)-dependent dehydrogenase (short-subunit alcohol dehydrogenase family)